MLVFSDYFWEKKQYYNNKWDFEVLVTNKYYMLFNIPNITLFTIRILNVFFPLKPVYEYWLRIPSENMVAIIFLTTSFAVFPPILPSCEIYQHKPKIFKLYFIVRFLTVSLKPYKIFLKSLSQSLFSISSSSSNEEIGQQYGSKSSECSVVIILAVLINFLFLLVLELNFEIPYY